MGFTGNESVNFFEYYPASLVNSYDTHGLKRCALCIINLSPQSDNLYCTISLGGFQLKYCFMCIVKFLPLYFTFQPDVNFLNLYGMTECSPLVTAMSPGSTNYSTVGHAVSNTELRIADSELKSLGVNEVGIV